MKNLISDLEWATWKYVAIFINIHLILSMFARQVESATSQVEHLISDL